MEKQTFLLAFCQNDILSTLLLACMTCGLIGSFLGDSPGVGDCLIANGKGIEGVF